MGSKILIIGACGQIGSELTFKLRSVYGDANVIADDISYNNPEIVNSGLFKLWMLKIIQALKVVLRNIILIRYFLWLP